MRLADLPHHETDALVIGAGPTGLMAGLVLARRGVQATVLDHKAGPTRESRALAVHARTMELYDQLGLAERVEADSYRAERLQLGDRPAALELESAQAGATRFPGVHIFEQSKNESLLTSALQDLGRPVWWQHELLHLHSDASAGTEPVERPVTALVNGPVGLSVIQARWCIGADGARSAVRRILDVPFDGVTDDATFWVADVRDVSGIPDRSIVLRFGTETFALGFPLGPGGHVRLISLAQGTEIDEGQALATARADFGISHGPVEWFSTYRVHHRVAARFRVGPVFLAGDAAHVHSPVGGQGMNTGLQDAHNLANLLADVAHGVRVEAALEQYERERRPVAQHLIAVTDRAFGVVGRPGRGVALLRQRGSAVAALLLPRLMGTQSGARLAGLVGQYRIRYRFAPPGPPPPWLDDPAVGRRLPPVADNNVSLRTFGWQLHSYGAALQPDQPEPELPEWLDGPREFGLDPAHRLRPDRVYLVRPDGFVAAALPVEQGRIAAGPLAGACAGQHLNLHGEPSPSRP